MASKKELVEAQAFSRRRLLTAFVSGTPGGRELEPTKPMRAVVAGVALSVLLVLGSMGFGLLKPGLPKGWDDNSLVLTKGSGTRFLAVKGTLYPVSNTTSARLLIPAGQFKVVEVPEAKIAEVPRGDRIGITGAPDELPSRENLLDTGWLTCVGEDLTLRTQIAPDGAGGELSDDSTVVTVAEDTYVVDGAYRYLVPTEHVTSVLRALDLESAPPREVPGLWLNVFAAGASLVPLTLDGAGSAVTSQLLPSDAVVGSVLEVGGTGGVPDRYVVTAGAELAPLTEVAYQLYQLGSGSTVGAPLSVTSAEIRDIKTARPLAPRTWPATASAPLDDDAPLCASLDGSATPTPGAHLATAPEDALPTTGADEVSVAPARGALVRATGDSIADKGPVHLIDQSGTTFAIPGASTDVLAQLGYKPADVAPVPQSWLALFPAGPELTAEAASRAPQVASDS